MINLTKKLALSAIFLSYDEPSSQSYKLHSGGILFFKNKKYYIQSPLEKKRTNSIMMGKDLQKSLAKLKIKKLGVSYNHFTLDKKRWFKGVKLVDITKDLLVEREVKTSVEIQKIRKSCDYTTKCFNQLIKNFNFKKESDITKYIKEFALKNELELAFDPIVASGKNAKIPHYAGDAKLTQGFLLIDFGFKYKGYCSDMTRTIYLGTPTKKQVELYDKVLKVQKECIENAIQGIKTKELDAKARISLNFNHALGHGVGLEVHEHPQINPRTTHVLKKGHVIAIEPADYSKEGIRIEDTVLILAKPKVLTNAKKSLIIANF